MVAKSLILIMIISLTTLAKAQTSAENEKKFSFSAYVGRGSWQNFKQRKETDNAYYTKEPTHGLFLASDIKYFFNEHWGIGISGKHYVSNEIQRSDINFLNVHHVYQNDYWITYLGGEACFRHNLNPKLRYWADLGLGLSYFTDFAIDGSNLGLSMNTGIDYYIFPKFALSFKTGMSSSTIYQARYSLGTRKFFLDTSIPIKILDLSIGIVLPI